MEAAAAVACRGGGVLARPLPGHRARRRHSVGPARRRFLVVASLEEAPSAPSRNAVAVAQEIVQVDEHEYVASSAILSPPHDHANTVQVKFVLQKQCAFGQRFLVVGDDPALGLWDPTKAAALEWSEDHVWTAKMDLPANKLVEFKFLLQDPSGHVSWQRGYNRTLQITETSNTLVVYEDWDDAKCQEVLEVVYPSIGVEFAGSCNGATLADDNQIDLNQQTDKDLTDGCSSPLREKMGGSDANRPQDLPANKLVEFKFLLQDPSGHVSWQQGYNRTLQITETSNTLVVYEDWDDAKCQEVLEVVYPSIGVEFAGSCNGATLADDNQIDLNQQTDKDLTDGCSSPLREKMGGSDANRPQFTLEKDLKIPDVLRRRANMAAQSGNPAAGRNDDNTLYEEGAPVQNRPASMFENDMVWLRKTLQRLLRNLGLQIGTTKT